ncbi:aminotransferase class V-fold PLP-dependent enzyme [Oxalobacteraceae bacterium R-40]|uniref:Aminotransferase class V-fold PLP-dependent enzyme n=1 Tax=Keguizhuia sedimenti TaxID=3064264 RepID=A0ABU1BK23_9BURK|nr:aminotransferase class V-fold PLP-dependent enzyme [Oxalobacteraceae bacterium R-40]
MLSNSPNTGSQSLLEYSVVYTERSLNHMSPIFQGVMKDVSATLKEVYNAHSVAIVPGGGTFGMEAVARQFGSNKSCLVIRNGWFSYRWTQIFEACNLPSESTVVKARRVRDEPEAPFAPAPIEEVVAAIKEKKPAVVFAPHVETSAGIMLTEEYMKAVADAVHSVGGLFVLDCIASGTIWLDMKACGIDVLISAPQKGWSAQPGYALLMLSQAAREKAETTVSTSFAADLKRWLLIMEAYESGSYAYHATMPTNSLKVLRDVMKETREYGFDKVRQQQFELGEKVRALLESKGIKSVAADGFKAPCVIVSYTKDKDVQSGKKFADAGLQIAAGVPLQCDEPADFQTFRIGLFGLDKLQNIDRTVENLRKALNQIV